MGFQLGNVVLLYFLGLQLFIMIDHSSSVKSLPWMLCSGSPRTTDEEEVGQPEIYKLEGITSSVLLENLTNMFKQYVRKQRETEEGLREQQQQLAGLPQEAKSSSHQTHTESDPVQEELDSFMAHMLSTSYLETTKYGRGAFFVATYGAYLSTEYAYSFLECKVHHVTGGPHVKSRFVREINEEVTKDCHDVGLLFFRISFAWLKAVRPYLLPLNAGTSSDDVDPVLQDRLSETLSRMHSDSDARQASSSTDGETILKRLLGGPEAVGSSTSETGKKMEKHPSIGRAPSMYAAHPKFGSFKERTEESGEGQAAQTKEKLKRKFGSFKKPLNNLAETRYFKNENPESPVRFAYALHKLAVYIENLYQIYEFINDRDSLNIFLKKKGKISKGLEIEPMTLDPRSTSRSAEQEMREEIMEAESSSHQETGETSRDLYSEVMERVKVVLADRDYLKYYFREMKIDEGLFDLHGYVPDARNKDGEEVEFTTERLHLTSERFAWTNGVLVRRMSIDLFEKRREERKSKESAAPRSKSFSRQGSTASQGSKSRSFGSSRSSSFSKEVGEDEYPFAVYPDMNVIDLLNLLERFRNELTYIWTGQVPIVSLTGGQRKYNFDTFYLKWNNNEENKPEFAIITQPEAKLAEVNQPVVD